MEYRLGIPADLDNICSLIRDAVIEMERHGIYQWDEIYPNRSDFEDDIRNHTLFVVNDKDILIAFYVISRECDEQYENGRWKYDENTAYILHRFCVAPKVQNRGLGKEILLHSDCIGIMAMNIEGMQTGARADLI